MMKSIPELNTPQEVEDYIEEVCRNLPDGFRQEVESRTWTSEERSKNLKVDAVCGALERLAELKSEKQHGILHIQH